MLSAVRQAVKRRVSGLARAVQASRQACSCATEPGSDQHVKESHLAGSVQYHDNHLLIKLPRPAEAASLEQEHGAWWPQLVEREPAILAAFTALAKHRDQVTSKVKITAYDDLGPASEGSSPVSGTVDMLAFPAGLRFTRLPLASVGDAVLLAVADDPSVLQLPRDSPAVKGMSEVQELCMFVCCHGARDARCGSTGPPLAAALLRGVREHGLQERVRVFQTSHVGGHKFAGNVLVHGAVSPCDGDWFGGVNAGNAEEFLDALLGVEIGVDGGAEDPVLRQFWRGRTGLSKEEQLELFAAGGQVEEVASDELSDDELPHDTDELEEWEEDEQGEGVTEAEVEGYELSPQRRGGVEVNGAAWPNR